MLARPTPVRFEAVVVVLSKARVTVSWDDLQALMRQLQNVQENAQLRATFSAGDATRRVQLRPGQRNALLRVLEAWSRDRDASDPISQDVVDLRDALTADVHDVGTQAAA